MNIKNIDSAMIKSVKDRVVTFTASDESVDRDNDIIRSDGWDYNNFIKSGSIIYGHDPRNKLPVAKPTEVKITNKQLLITAEFAKKGTSEFNDAVYSLVEQGILKGVSVGFMSSAQEPNDKGGITFLKQELLELSLTPIPANANARVLVKDFDKEIQDKLFEEEKEEITIEVINKLIETKLKELMEKEEEVQDEDIIAEPEQKTLTEKEIQFVDIISKLKTIF